MSVAPWPAWGDEADLPRRSDHDLSQLASLMVGASGHITSWSATAASLFGLPASAATGYHLCDVLLTGPGQRAFVGRALDEVAAGRVLTATVAGGNLGEGRFAIRWEPWPDPPGDALVILQRVAPQPRPGWLSTAAAQIGSTLDLYQTASEVADASVPEFSDMAGIFVTERLLAAGDFAAAAHGRGVVVRRLAVRFPGAGAAPAEELLRSGDVLLMGEETPGYQAMAGGVPVLSDHLDGEAADWLANGSMGRALAASCASLLAVPLAARGGVVGCAVFGRDLASPPFTPADIALAGELASRAAVCIDNARLYQRERRTAMVLQQALLPGQHEVPPGMEVAHRYLPVGASMVGGDWYDMVALPGGKAALVVGDAMGHGPEAAAVMVQLRTAAHTLAGLGLPPGPLLHRLDGIAAGMANAPFATCIVTVIDPAAGTCVAAQAGHLPPVLVLPDGETVMPDLPPGLPLGLGADHFDTTVVTMPRGATIALYTDGLVESRARSLDAGLAALREALRGALTQPHRSLGGACEAVTQALREDGEDDITLVLARVRA